MGKPVRLADPPSLLAGREDLLADLHTRLSGGDGPRPRTVALCGFGGAGKTSVALAYAHSHLAEVRVAWQLAAENPTVLADGFGQLAAQLGVRDVVDIRDPVASVHGLLAAFPDEWLLIFDNAPDRASVQAFLPPAGPGRVMITSQNPSWPYGQLVPVPLLGAEVATDFLLSRTGDPDRQSAVDLAGELDGLPLALEQAAAYIQATQGTLAGYLDLFQQRRAEMLARGEPTGYDKTVASTWALAFGRLCESAPGASGLLRLLACCAPEAIPLRLLLQPRPGLAERFGGEVAVLGRLLEDPLAVSDAVAALRRYSLVVRAHDGSVLVHRLVQNVMLCRMPADLAGQWRQASAALIEAAIPGDTELPGTWQACAELLPHAQVALADDSDGMARIATYLGFSGNFAAARDLHQRVVDARERILGAEHLGTLLARYQLAFWTGAAGYRAEARDLFAGLLPVQEQVLGPEHPDALATRHQLARWTGHLGDPGAARDQFAALLPVEERVLGPEHMATLGVRYQVARWTGEAGDPGAARDQFAALLPVEERVLGMEHTRTLFARANLAR
jgi:Tetratricopeptide repeat